MSIIETLTVEVTVTIPVTVQYTYTEGYPGDPTCPPSGATVAINAWTIEVEDVLAALEEDNNWEEIESTTLQTHEENEK
jgi:hypothetical protein